MGSTDKQKADALKVYATTIRNCQKMLPKFAPKTAQATLLNNRINALQVVVAVVSGDQRTLTVPQLTAAVAPIASIIHKTSKARAKYQPNERMYHRLTPMIDAMTLGLAAIKQQLAQKTSTL